MKSNLTLPLLLALLIALLSGAAVAATPPIPTPGVFFRVPSNSMHPAIPEGVLVIAERIVEPLAKGDIVVATNSNGAQLALRVVGLPGDRIRLDNGHAFVNDEVVPNDGAPIPARRIGFAQFPRWTETLVVPKDDLYLLADNRVDGVDSIELGTFSRSKVTTRLVLWSQAIEQKGRVQATFREAMVPFRKRLPLAVDDGWKLIGIDAPSDTVLRITYRIDSKTSRKVYAAGIETLKTDLGSNYCQNQVLQMAEGLNVEVIIQTEKNPIILSFQQNDCEHK